MPAFEWVHVQLHQQKGMISLSPPTICNSAKISCQLKLIRFTGESAIAFSLLSGQKVNGHIGLPA
ncbi:hypothetical protein [Escherichia coli]|uniref:hypothetical protein n=1 Tax=Escherichia coli TaxID=562 RepID=UPI00039F929B|nr:hypothetical protein [Escherichia coli]